MGLDLFAGIPVTDYTAALPWYEQFFGGRPAFLPNDTEAVWEVADLDDRVAEIASRGIEPARRETPSSGVIKVIYKDKDGNEISFGGALT